MRKSALGASNECHHGDAETRARLSASAGVRYILKAGRRGIPCLLLSALDEAIASFHAGTPMNATDPTPSSAVLPPGAASRSPSDSTQDLFAFLYDELHRLAKRHLRNRSHGLTLGTTTLLHELYLNVAERRQVQFSDRTHFMGYASRAMRGLIVDYSRRRAAAKRGGEFHLVSLGDDEDTLIVDETARELAELGDALDELAAVDPRLAELIDLSFFCGLTFVEIAGLRGVSERTVLRDWRKARLILHRVLRPPSPEDEPR